MNSHYHGYQVEQKNLPICSQETNKYFSDHISESGAMANPLPQSTPNMFHPSNTIFPFGLNMQQSIQHQRTSLQEDPIERLKFFLATSPTNWDRSEALRRFPLGNGETIACIFWKGQFYVTGTDIVKILHFRFQFIQRPIINAKKFEEGIFSDLRNLKPGLDAALEEPRSEFLELLYRNGCIRTQKKQKVFYWYSVPHERLFVDALERDLKRESNLIHVNAFLGRHQPCFPYLPHQLQKQSRTTMMPISMMGYNSNGQHNMPIHSTPHNQAVHSAPIIEPQQKELITSAHILATPPLVGPQPIKPASNYFGHQPETFSAMQQKGFGSKVEDLGGHLNYLAYENGSTIEDYFGPDPSYLPSTTYTPNYNNQSHSSYAAIPEGAIRRPNLFDTFI